MTIQTFNSYDEMIQERQKVLKHSAKDFTSKMSGMNADFTIINEAAFTSKTTNLGGKKFRVCVFTDENVCGAMSHQTKRDIGAVVQIWSGAKSAILPLPKDCLEDARKNWRDEYRIAADDIVSQAISALRLNSQQPIIHNLAMFCAYDNDGVDDSGCHSVWD